MEKKNKLLKRIEELENLVEQQKQLIDILNWEIQQNNFKRIPVLEGDCPSGGWHDYPNPWHGTTPPFCKKCGQLAPDYGTTYLMGNVDKDISNFT